MFEKEYYLTLQKKYHPQDLKLIFILESPPISGLYFYDCSGKTSEPLFNELMKLFKINAKNKEEGLREFQNRGYLLIDSTYKQINDLRGKDRDNEILDDYVLLVEDLKEINPTKSIPLILVKANVCKLLENPLTREGFRVLNDGVVIPFPSTGQQKRFHSKVLDVLTTEGIEGN